MRLCCLIGACWLSAVALDAADTRWKTRNVILVTVDGLRHEELFTGLDSKMLEDKKLSGIEDVDKVRSRYWRDTPEERRQALFPFFWQTFARQGVVLGNKAKGSRVLLRNRRRFSYPGYAELLTGQARESIDSNRKRRIPWPTLLDFATERLTLDNTQVAVFASWDVFPYFVSHREESFVCNAGYEALPEEMCSPEMNRINRLQMHLLTPWDSVRHDSVTLALALGYLEKYRPRILYLALGETDDWAHERRYDRMLEAARIFDDGLRDLWYALQSLDTYRGRTTVIITTDHGRGGTLEDWTDHGENVAGAEDVWVAIAGPDTPRRGELEDTATVYLADIAATALELLGLSAEDFNPEAGPSIRSAFAQEREP